MKSLSAYPRGADLSGLRFGAWTVLGRDRNRSSRDPRWQCRCDCNTIRSVLGSELRNGGSKSCGCLQKAARTEQARLVRAEGSAQDALPVIRPGHVKSDALARAFRVLHSAQPTEYALWLCRTPLELAGYQRLADRVRLLAMAAARGPVNTRHPLYLETLNLLGQAIEDLAAEATR